MTVINEKFSLTLKGNDVIDLTSKIEGLARTMNAKEAQFNINAVNPVSSIIVSNDIGQIGSIMSLMESLVPADNANFPYLRATILGHNVSIPVVNNTLQLLQYQKVFLINFDYKSSVQDVVVSLIYKEQNGQE